MLNVKFKTDVQQFVFHLDSGQSVVNLNPHSAGVLRDFLKMCAIQGGGSFGLPFTATIEIPTE